MWPHGANYATGGTLSRYLIPVHGEPRSNVIKLILDHEAIDEGRRWYEIYGIVQCVGITFRYTVYSCPVKRIFYTHTHSTPIVRSQRRANCYNTSAPSVESLLNVQMDECVGDSRLKGAVSI